MRILIILKYCYIGDAVVSIPLIKGVGSQWPEARITILTSQGACKLLPIDPELATCEFVAYGPRTTQRNFVDSVKLTMESFRFDGVSAARGASISSLPSTGRFASA